MAWTTLGSDECAGTGLLPSTWKAEAEGWELEVTLSYVGDSWATGTA